VVPLNSKKTHGFPKGLAVVRCGDVLAIDSGMACRIQVLDRDAARTVTVAGQLAGAHIPDLLVACGDVSPALQVDLTDVLSTDPIAVEALQRLREGGAQLVGVPVYIQLKLASPARGTGPR
jgi:hypothetical protein